MKRYSCQKGNRQHGVTLVELVAVIVLLGIIGIGLSNFIRSGAEAYVEVTRRDEITQIGRFAVERISRELRTALPGSVRVSTTDNCIEFIPVLAASFYSRLPIVNFSAESTDFEVVDFEGNTSITHAAVYTLNESDVYNLSNNHVIPIDISSASTTGDITTIDFNPAVARQFNENSPGKRIYFIAQPVSFCIVGSNLNRYQNYGYQVLQSIPSDGQLLAEFIQLNDNGSVVTPFRASNPTLQRNGVVTLDLRFRVRDANNEWVRFRHDVALRGVP